MTALAGHPTWTFNINRYPPLTEVGEPAPGQFRIGPHTDFGTVTVLDREPGAGGLQVDTAGTGWADAPYDPAAFTVNIGTCWSTGRACAGVPAGTGCCRRSRARRTRSSCRWCSSSSSTTMRS